jgi:hypothetical protein
VQHHGHEGSGSCCPSITVQLSQSTQVDEGNPLPKLPQLPPEPDLEPETFPRSYVEELR